jgi:tetratricopeptide (TPR) repeat protein
MSSQSNHTRYPSYLDFEIEIGPSEGGVYPLAIIHSPVGESRTTTTFPFDTQQPLEIQLPMLAEALRDIKTTRDVVSSEAQSVQTFGQALFEALLPDELRSLYYESRREASRQGKGLRIKLRIQPPELAVLPWEFLYDPRQAEYVCLSLTTPVVRYIEQPQAIEPLRVMPPLRILGIVASPSDLAPLNVDREQRCLEEALAHLKAHQVVELAWLVNPTWRMVQQEIRRSDWHIFHFVGHGGFDRQANTGFIAFADDTGSADYLSATQLGRLLGDHKPLRLALLNACEGAQGSMGDLFASTAANLVRRGTPAVLAMQYPISDSAAIEFARTFYESLADAWPVDAAVAEARKAITFTASSTVEWGIPVLFMRASDGMVFDIPKQTASDKLSDHVAERAQPAPSEDARPIESADTQADQQIAALFAQLLQAQANRGWDTTIELGTQILELARTQPSIRSKVAEIYIACGHSNYQSTDFDRAIRYFDLAIALEPEQAVWYYWRGSSYYQAVFYGHPVNGYEHAIDDFTRAIELDPGNPDSYYARGNSYYQLAVHRSSTDVDSAIADFMHAIDLAPNTADYYYARGMCYKLQRNRQAAQHDFERAVQLGHPRARSELDLWKRLFS